MSPPNPSLLLLEMVEFGELLRESPSPSDSPGSLRLLGRKGRCALKKQKVNHVTDHHKQNSNNKIWSILKHSDHITSPRINNMKKKICIVEQEAHTSEDKAE